MKRIIPNSDIEYIEINMISKGSYGNVSKIKITDKSLKKYPQYFPKGIEYYALKVTFSQPIRLEKQLFGLENFITNVFKSKCNPGLLCFYFSTFDEETKNGFFISELMDGDGIYFLKNLETQIKENKNNESYIIDQLNLMYIQLYLALEQLHENNIFHSDIKLENFLYRKEGFLNWKIGDFGSGCIESKQISEQKCGKDPTYGTLQTSDPMISLALIDSKISNNIDKFQSDNFSFGISLFYLWYSIFGKNRKDFFNLFRKPTYGPAQFLIKYDELEPFIFEMLETTKQKKVLQAFSLYVEIYAFKRIKLFQTFRNEIENFERERIKKDQQKINK